MRGKPGQQLSTTAHSQITFSLLWQGIFSSRYKISTWIIYQRILETAHQSKGLKASWSAICSTITNNALKFCCTCTCISNRPSATVRCGGRGCVWTKARSTLALPVWHCRRTLKGSLEQIYLFTWDSCLRWFMGVKIKILFILNWDSPRTRDHS